MGSFRSQPDNKIISTSKQVPGHSFAASSMCGWRLYMEDAHLSIPNFKTDLSLYAVFDGHGGAQVSAFVQRHFPKFLETNEAFKKGEYQKALKQAFLGMDTMLQSQAGRQQIKKIQKEMREKQNGPSYQQASHAGCTANVCLITKDYIYVANAGDSRAVASVGGKCVQLSYDHKPQNRQQIDRITKAGGSVSFGRVNGNLNLSRAIGDLQYKMNKKLKPEQHMITANPDIKKVQNKNFDFIIMGCDGIWETKSNEDMIKWITKRLQKKDTAILEELLNELLAKDSGGQYGMDNMSAILIRFEKKK